MFTIFSLRKGSRPFSDQEKEYLASFLRDYSALQIGAWLAAVDWPNFEFRWCPAMTIQNGIMGAFSLIYPRTIFLMEPTFVCATIAAKANRPFWVDVFLPTIVHELRHVLQYQRNQILYTLCCLPVLRQLTIERDAKKATDDVAPFAQKWGCARDREEVRRLSKKTQKNNKE